MRPLVGQSGFRTVTIENVGSACERQAMSCAIHGIESLCGPECEGYIWPARRRRSALPAVPAVPAVPAHGLPELPEESELSPELPELPGHVERELGSMPEGPAYPEGESTERVGE